MKRILKAYGLIAAVVGFGTIAWVGWPLPDSVAHPPAVEAVELRDRHGLHLRRSRNTDGSRAQWTALEDVDPQIIHAFLAAEDRRFFQHLGVDTKSVIRAARDNVVGGRVVSGASTITMQTARLLRPMPRTWMGKVTQMLWAARIEAHRNKDWILEQYLNRVPLGQGAVGIGAAAELYFAASASQLSLGQAALLAGLARQPSRDNPMASRDRARETRARVLGQMVALGQTDQSSAHRARSEPVLGRPAPGGFLAPHFTTWALGSAIEVGSHAGGASLNEVGSAEPGVVMTTLDLELQRALEAEVRHTVEELRELEVHHGALVVLDNRTGGILAWVGSPDFWADGDGQVDMVRSRRQPGSTLKPFLYGLALERGYTAATVLPDVPISFATAAGPYQPQNYDRRFRGPVRLRVALASSLNVPAVELGRRIGTGAFLSTLRSAGFESLDRNAGVYGLGLALGNGEVTLLELANAYRGLVAGGMWRPVSWTLGRNDPWNERRFMGREEATMVLDMLADPAARLEGFGTHTPLDFPFRAAAKTGTSRHFTDNWAVATAEHFTVAVWVGNFNGRPMRSVSGVTGAGPLLSRAVYETAKRYDPGVLPFPQDVGAESRTVCMLSGLLPANDCATTMEWFLPGTAPAEADDWEAEGRVALPPEYGEWFAATPRDGLPAVVRSAESRRSSAAAATPAVAPAGVAFAGGAADEDPHHKILSPRDGDEFQVPLGVDPRYATVPLLAEKAGGVRWFVNGIEVDGGRWHIASGGHTIRAEWPGGDVDSVRVRGASRQRHR